MLLEAIAAKSCIPRGPSIEYKSKNVENAIAFLTLNGLGLNAKYIQLMQAMRATFIIQRTQEEQENYDRAWHPPMDEYRKDLEIHITITPAPYNREEFHAKCTYAIEIKKMGSSGEPPVLSMAETATEPEFSS